MKIALAGTGAMGVIHMKALQKIDGVEVVSIAARTEESGKAFANIRKTGVARTLISTDLGQTINPPVAEGFAMFAQKLLDAGFSADDVRMMAVTNPTRLVED